MKKKYHHIGICKNSIDKMKKMFSIVCQTCKPTIISNYSLKQMWTNLQQQAVDPRQQTAQEQSTAEPGTHLLII